MMKILFMVLTLCGGGYAVAKEKKSDAKRRQPTAKAIKFCDEAFRWKSKVPVLSAAGIAKLKEDFKKEKKVPKLGEDYYEESAYKDVMNTISVEDAYQKYYLSNSSLALFIDARKAKDRKSGIIPYTLPITGNAKGFPDNQFSHHKLWQETDKLAKNIAKKAKKAKKTDKVKGVEAREGNKKTGKVYDFPKKIKAKQGQFEKFQYIVFCNGRKCHRSTHGACELIKMGIPQNSVHVMLDGYPGWRGAGFDSR